MLNFYKTDSPELYKFWAIFWGFNQEWFSLAKKGAHEVDLSLPPMTK